MGYYVIKFISEPYTLQEETVCNRKISIVGELVVKAQYMNYMQDNKKIYWGGKTQQKKYNWSLMHNCTSMLGYHHRC